jgi:hypothetical protein
MFESNRLDDAVGYFQEYPAPVFKAMWEQTFAPMNSTTPYYGPLLYWLCRCADASDVLEIGIATAWSSVFMAHAVAEANSRYKANGMYYGVDVGDKKDIFAEMHKMNLPAKFIQKDSWDLVPADWDNRQLNLVFQDGWHSDEYVMRELDILLPYLKGNGDGYWVMHDVYSWCEGVFEKIKQLHPNWEVIRFKQNYGLAIFRNMDGYDYNARYWHGPQPHLRGG